jgi:aspartyl-tRNA(Asn)/glutamyl-tRNA(Gln) amidotransferase subunit B
VQETLHFDPGSGALTPLRSKEEAHDYRYFPEPDLVPIVVDEATIESVRAQLPELPAARAERYGELGLSEDFARQLAFRPELGEYFERVVAATEGVDPQAAANWVAAELAKRLGDEPPASSKVTPEALGALVAMAADGRVTAGAARQVLDRLVAEGGDPAAIVEQEGLGALGDGDALAGIVAQAIEANPDAVESIRAGRGAAIGKIVGHVMRETRGRADGGEVSRLIREQLGA